MDVAVIIPNCLDTVIRVIVTSWCATVLGQKMQDASASKPFPIPCEAYHFWSHQVTLGAVRRHSGNPVVEGAVIDNGRLFTFVLRQSWMLLDDSRQKRLSSLNIACSPLQGKVGAWRCPILSWLWVFTFSTNNSWLFTVVFSSSGWPKYGEVESFCVQR